MLTVSSTGPSTNTYRGLSTSLGLLTTRWSEDSSHASHLTTDFLEAEALLPVLFVTVVTEPAHIQGTGKRAFSSCWGSRKV